MRRKWWVGLVAGGVLAAAIGTGAVAFANPSSQEEDGDADTATVLERTAADLGIEPDALRDAVRAAVASKVDEAVANGDLTQERADAIKERLADAPDGALIGGVFPGKHLKGHGGFEFPGGRGGHFDFKFGFGFGMIDGDEGLAEFLGIDAEQLRTELMAEGTSLAEVAEAHGKSRDDLKSFLLDKVNEKLDAAVADGGVTQERADEMRVHMDEMIDGIIDREFGGRFRPMMPGMPGMPDLPDDESGTNFQFEIDQLS